MILPKKLNKGDKIGFFSPSSAATSWAPKRFERSKKFLKDKGFILVPGKLTGKQDSYRSGNIKERTDELNQLIRDPEIRCIISTIGGLNSNSIIPYIDYESLKKDPKIIIGYSDVTAILMAIYSKIGLITFYGPALVASFGEFPPLVDETFNYFELIAISPTIPYTIKNPDLWTDEFIDWEAMKYPKNLIKNKLQTLNSGIVSGRLIVGNLNTIQGIFGSPYMPSIQKGDILVIEDCMDSAGMIERSFAFLKVNGIFEILGGLVLGKHEKFDDQNSGKKPYEILMEIIGKVDFPILAEYDCSHTHPMITLPIGIKAELNADSQTLTLIEEWVEK